MAESDDDSSKTEEPSQKKLEEARERGQIASSRELNHFFMMGAFLFFIAVMMPGTMLSAMHLLAPYITKPDDIDMGPGGVVYTMRHVLLGMLTLLLLPFLLTWAGALAPAILQRKIHFTTEHIKPKFSKLNPLAGFSRIFGFKAIIEFIKNLSKVFAIGAICTMVILPYRNKLPQLMTTAHRYTILQFSQVLANKLLIGMCMFLFLLGIIDYVYQHFQIRKSLRMSKHELKDEYKQQEGDPHVKGKLRQIRRERAKKRMMANVPKADVIITNPTHFAVALKYDAATMQAPVMLAKGADEVAARIRERAAEHRIPIIRNPPLARILYDTAEIDEEIPIEHYQAVAKIIGYVYKLKGKKLGGNKPAAPAYKKPKPKGGSLPEIKLKK
jgi:flagellar biosynthetic protein FlhB